MASLLSIPFEVHVLIVRKLSLKDCIAYMQVCTVAHDVVYYVFAHRKELDFESVLDESGTIALRQEMLMKVSYAHTRAVSMINFCLNPSFAMLDEFKRYFNLYWSYKVVEPNQFEPCLEAVCHPTGHLERIRYLGCGGGGSTRDQCLELHSLWDRNQYWYMVYGGMTIQHNDQTKSYLTRTEPNWSLVDIDAPYTWCRVCTGVCMHDMESDGSTKNSGSHRDVKSDDCQL
jgi:hypothetical protein